MTGSPGFSRWMPAGTAVYYRESRDRLKPGLLSGNVRIRCSMFIRRLCQLGTACWMLKN